MSKQHLAADLDEIGGLLALLSAAQRIEALLDEALRSRVGVSYSWFELLLGLADAPEERLLIGELGRRLSLTSGGVTRFVDRVEAAGLVTREPSATDRRALYVTFTERGKDVVAKGLSVLRDVNAEHVSGPMTKAQRASLTDALPRVARSAPARISLLR